MINKAKKVKKIEPIHEKVMLEVRPKKRVCAYARVSTDSIEQQDYFYYQVEYYKSYIGKRDDWEYAGIYSDEGKIDLIITKKVMNNTRMKEVKIIHKICKKSD